jgi:hypothetical protein
MRAPPASTRKIIESSGANWAGCHSGCTRKVLRAALGRPCHKLIRLPGPGQCACGSPEAPLGASVCCFATTAPVVPRQLHRCGTFTAVAGRAATRPRLKLRRCGCHRVCAAPQGALRPGCGLGAPRSRAHGPLAKKSTLARAHTHTHRLAAGVAAPKGFARSLALIALPSQSLRQTNRRLACSKHDRPPIGAAGPPEMRLIPLWRLSRAPHPLFAISPLSSKEHSRIVSPWTRNNLTGLRRPQVRKTTIMPDARVPCGCARVPAVTENG